MLAVLTVLTLVSDPAVRAVQGQVHHSPLVGPAKGASMDRFWFGDFWLMAMSYRFSALRPGGLGPELGVSLFPQGLSSGIVTVAPDLGLSYNIPAPGGSVLIKAGGSAFTAMGTGGALFIPGVHLGGVYVLQTGDRSGLRLDVIRHHYWGNGERAQPVWSVGLGFAILRRKVFEPPPAPTP